MAMQKITEKMLTVSVVFLMALSFASTTSMIAMAQVQQPTYSVGDEWKYSIEFLSGDEIVTEGTTTRRIIGEENVMLDSEEYECFVVEIIGSWEPVQSDTITYTETGKVYIQKSDLSIVKQDMETKQMSGEDITYHQITNITYSPPFEDFDFPMDVGKIWWANTTRTQTIELPPLPPFPPNIAEISQNFTVVKTEEVTVPAGTFDTLVTMSSTSDNIFEEYYSSRANANVLELVYDDEMNLIQRTELLESNRIVPLPGALDLTLVLIIVVVAVVIIVVIIIFIRRRPAGVPKTTPVTQATKAYTSRKL
jgi:hypothetical protein